MNWMRSSRYHQLHRPRFLVGSYMGPRNRMILPPRQLAAANRKRALRIPRWVPGVQAGLSANRKQPWTFSEFPHPRCFRCYLQRIYSKPHPARSLATPRQRTMRLAWPQAGAGAPPTCSRQPRGLAGGIARSSLCEPPRAGRRALFPLFYLVEIRHRQLRQSQSRTRPPLPVRMKIQCEYSNYVIASSAGPCE
jgi:hypothetical protein